MERMCVKALMIDLRQYTQLACNQLEFVNLSLLYWLSTIFIIFRCGGVSITDPLPHSYIPLLHLQHDLEWAGLCFKKGVMGPLITIIKGILGCNLDIFQSQASIITHITSLSVFIIPPINLLVKWYCPCRRYTGTRG